MLLSQYLRRLSFEGALGEAAKNLNELVTATVDRLLRVQAIEPKGATPLPPADADIIEWRPTLH